HFGPRALVECSGGRLDCEVDVGLLAGGSLNVGLVSDRVEHIEPRAAAGANAPTVKVVLDAFGEGAGLSVAKGCVSHGSLLVEMLPCLVRGRRLKSRCDDGERRPQS